MKTEMQVTKRDEEIDRARQRVEDVTVHEGVNDGTCASV